MTERTKEWTYAKEQLLILTGGAKGSGNDKHIVVGGNDSYRTLMKFTANFSGVARIIKAELTMRTTDSDKHVTKGSREIRLWSIKAAFTEKGGGEDSYDSQGTVWGEIDWDEYLVNADVPGADGTPVTIDVTSYVNRIAPVSVLQSDGVTPGEGKPNNGWELNEGTGAWEAKGIRNSTVNHRPTLLLTYDDSAAPTVTLVSPTDDTNARARVLNVQDPLKEMSAELVWQLFLGPTDTKLLSHAWRLYDVDAGDLLIDSGNGQLEGLWPVTEAHESVSLVGGKTYRLEIDAEGDGGGGVMPTVSKTFVFPAGESIHSISLGTDPTDLGVAPLTLGDIDEKASHYALSSDGTVGGIVGDWSASLPILLPGTWWLLIRSRIRRAGVIDPIEPEGFDKYTINWVS